MAIHEFMDASKGCIADNRHRALTHHAWFISTVIPRVFGETFQNSVGRTVHSRDIAEQHCLEDFGGFIPSGVDFLAEMEYHSWMEGKGTPPSMAKIVKRRKEKLQETLNCSKNEIGKVSAD